MRSRDGVGDHGAQPPAPAPRARHSFAVVFKTTRPAAAQTRLFNLLLCDAVVMF